MPDFLIRVFDPVHGVQQSRISAPDCHAVAAQLGVAPQRILSVQEVGAVAAGGLKLWPASRGTKRFPLQLFSQELAVLLDAGIALLEALSTVREKESRTDVQQALDEVIAMVREGRALSVAMQAQPAVFDELVCAIVAANERTGQLALALSQHAKYLAWVEALRSRLVAACVYPLLLLIVGGAVIMFLLLFVLPRFAGILDGLGDKLPWASQVLISFGRVAGEHPGLALGGAAMLVFGAVVVWRHPSTHQALIHWAWRMPGLGPRLRVLALARLYPAWACCWPRACRRWPRCASCAAWSRRPGARRWRRRPRWWPRASGCRPPSRHKIWPRRWRGACCASASAAASWRRCWSGPPPSMMKRRCA